ncbi:MAG: hypothetical protein WC607_04610 [Candidatus Micrarchaeia archaeon]
MALNKVYIGLLAFALLFAGCLGSTETPTPTPTALPSVEPSPLPSPTPSPSFTPIELEYETMDFFGSGSELKATITYWFEEEAVCSGKKAFNGVYAVTGSQMGDSESVWAKTTYYYEDGELASTEFTQKSGLVFESTKTVQAFIIPNFIQELFASAGVDFASSEVWDSTKPLLLNDVSLLGGSKGNISIVNKGAGDGVIPCTEFALYSQGSPYAVIACATKPTETAPYSITVYIATDEDWPTDAGTMPTWRLTRAPAVKASGESALLECIDFIRCNYVESPTQAEYDDCEEDGDSKMRENYDSHDCVTDYECKSISEIALEQITGSQAPDCDLPSQGIINAVEECIGDDSGPINWVSGSDGCIVEASC